MPLSLTFKNELKLKQKNEIDRVFQQPSIKIGSAFFLILARENQLPVPRLGLIVAKKNLKKAMDRNQVKRISREFFRVHQQILQGYDWVVLTRPAVKTLLPAKAKKKAGLDGVKPGLSRELRNIWHRALQKMPKHPNGKTLCEPLC
jgi:ribonuclease P protein component